jgi:transcriptional regulator with XRE-family HTH domain
MEKQPPKRTVRPDAEAIKRPRLAKGWRVEDLAAKAICSVKTVENVERGANVYVFTLAKLAKQLGVDFMTLVQGGKAPSEPRAPRPCIQVQLVLSIPFDQFDESDQLEGCVEVLTKFLRGWGEMKVVGVAPGNSTIITVLVNNDDMTALSKAYSAGKLAEIQCVDLRLKSLTPGWHIDNPNHPVTPKKPFRPSYSQRGKPLKRKTTKSKPKPGPRRRKPKKHKPETKS